MVLSVRILILLLFILVSCSDHKPFYITAPEGEGVSQIDSKLDLIMLDFMENEQIANLAAVIVKDEKIYRSGYGYEDYKNDILVDPDQTMFRWASISKSLTATLVVDAYIKNLLDLDDPINLYIPEYISPSKLVNKEVKTDLSETYIPSFKQLLSHRSGIRHYQALPNGDEVTPPRSQRNNPDINTGMLWGFEKIMGSPLIKMPDSYSYSTPGFNLAGAALERALAKDFDTIISENLSQVIGAPSIRVDKFWLPIAHRAMAQRRIRRGDVEYLERSDVSWKAAGGGIISTVRDIGIYCKAFLNEDYFELNQKHSILWREFYSGKNYALGHRIYYANGTQIINHNGSNEGASSSMVILPAKNICFALMTSTKNIDVKYLSKFLFNYFTNEEFDFEEARGELLNPSNKDPF